MSALTILESVQFVIGQDGRPTAVQIGMEAMNDGVSKYPATAPPGAACGR